MCECGPAPRSSTGTVPSAFLAGLSARCREELALPPRCRTGHLAVLQAPVTC